MPNGSTHSDRLQQDLGVTNQRVFTVEKGLADLSSAQERQGLRLSAEIEGVFTKLTSEIRNLSPQFAERTKVPWGAIGVMQVGVIALGGVLYWPIRENQSDFKDALRELKTTMISRSDVDYKFSVTGQRRDDFQRMSEQRDKEMDGKIEQIRDRIVPRSE
ncbi:hypothetical protein, partial [Methylobacterium gnaphalii]|uniref:hypothetical protein n=1 Tax=Methylobacterium gnaphalii TaxID=1010610 RepID=UPI0011BD58C8